MKEQKILEEQLGIVNQSVFYLILTVLSVLLSIWPVLVQREQLEEMLAGKPAKNCREDVLSVRLSAAAVAVSALGFFFYSSLQVYQDVSCGRDFAAQKSAEMNVWASLFAFAAALIHIYDLIFAEKNQCCLAGEAISPALV